MKTLIIDGQGGGLGRAITAALRQAVPDLALIALGTNAIATTAMLKAGAQQGATGESAIRWQCRDAGLILGPTGLLTAGALLGEISPAIAAAVGESPAHKLLIPSDRCNVQVIGVKPQSMDDAVRELVERVRAIVTNTAK
jgi:lysophospholipase L1-like esterase